MLKNENIICISSIDWDFLWQHHQVIMSTFAKNNNRILFIENTGIRAPSLTDIPRLKKRIINWFKSVKGFRKEMDNLYVYSPLILPFPYFKIARWINRYLLFKPLIRWMRVMEFYEPIIWTFLPTPIVLDLIEEIPYKAFVYYCTDNFPATSKAAQKVIKYERQVLRRADIVFVMAKNMLNYCLTYNKNITCIPMGVDTEVFSRVDDINTKPTEIENIHNHIIGYIGGIRQSVDQRLMGYLAEKLVDCTFIFVGPIQTDSSFMKRFKNIIFIGRKLHSELPKYIKHFDACIIPYKKDDYTDNISSAKLNEYLIMGKPVISTNLKEIENFNKENENIVYIANSYQDFANLILEAIKQDNEVLKCERIEIARKNSWDNKIEQMSVIIESWIKKKKDLVINWQERLIKIYRDIHKRTVSIGFTLFVLWLLIFYTPLVWFLAEPLKITQSPQKADAIVVFAGGVGESGKAGQGYEERIEYTTELYKKGYAKHIVFSSGYTYVFKEPQVMKALAVSLGIPADAIILEENAKNTYENVKFSKEIIDKNNWKGILLVSSPYHMRRVSLVFNKIAPYLKTVYTPIPRSHFYIRQVNLKGKKTLKQVSIRQIKGILHEYLGILYYWIKGYI